MEEKININKASVQELIKIKFIGAIRAAKIVEKRPYKDIYELSNAAGLGRKRIDAIIAEGKATI